MTSKSTTIGEFILKQIEENQNRDWDSIFKALGIFLALFWVFICIWVYFDVRSRYKRRITAVLVTLFVLIFNIPALIIYVVLRPEHTREEIKLIQSAQLFPISFDPKILGNSLTPLKLSFTLDVSPDPDGKNPPKINVSMIGNDNLQNVLENTSEKPQEKKKGDSKEIDHLKKDKESEIKENIVEPTRLEAENVEIVEEKKAIPFKERLKGIKEKLMGIGIKKQLTILPKLKKPIFTKINLKKDIFNKILSEVNKIPSYRAFDFKTVFKKQEKAIIILPSENEINIIKPQELIKSEDQSIKSIAKSKKKKKNRRR